MSNIIYSRFWKCKCWLRTCHQGKVKFTIRRGYRKFQLLSIFLSLNSIDTNFVVFFLGHPVWCKLNQVKFLKLFSLYTRCNYVGCLLNVNIILKLTEMLPTSMIYIVNMHFWIIQKKKNIHCETLCFKNRILSLAFNSRSTCTLVTFEISFLDMIIL